MQYEFCQTGSTNQIEQIFVVFSRENNIEIRSTYLILDHCHSLLNVHEKGGLVLPISF